MFGERPHVLAALRHSHRALARARTLGSVKAIRDGAEAAREYARCVSFGLDVENRAAEIKVRAERKAGKMLAELELSHGGRPTTKKPPAKTVCLRRLGINKSQSSRWQLAASVPDDVFEEFIAKAKQLGEHITSEALLRIAEHLEGRPSPRKKSKPSFEQCPSTSPAKPDTAKVVACEPLIDHSEVLEMIVEALNHQKLLDDVLQPALSNPGDHLPEASRRVAKTKLAETKQLLTKVIRFLDKSATPIR
jgi:hypothetical protein